MTSSFGGAGRCWPSIFDLDEDQFAWMAERMVPEGAPKLLLELVDLTPLRSAVPRTWARPMREAIVPNGPGAA